MICHKHNQLISFVSFSHFCLPLFISLYIPCFVSPPLYIPCFVSPPLYIPGFVSPPLYIPCFVSPLFISPVLSPPSLYPLFCLPPLYIPCFVSPHFYPLFCHSLFSISLWLLPLFTVVNVFYDLFIGCNCVHLRWIDLVDYSVLFFSFSQNLSKWHETQM